MRDKEKVHDYRFLPEPNLPPLRVYTDSHTPPAETPSAQIINVDRLHDQIPMLPSERREQLQNMFNMSLEHSYIFLVSLCDLIRI